MQTRHICPISGKDSLATFIVQRELAPALPYELMFNPTGAETPEVEEWLQKVEARYGLPIARVGDNLEDIIAEKGILPGVKARYCTLLAKIYPMEDWIGKDPAIVYYGIRADEKRQGYIQNKKTNITPAYPLVTAGITLADVWRILEQQDLLPPLFFWQSMWNMVKHMLGSYAGVLDTLSKPEKAHLFAGRSRANCSFCLAGETEVVTSRGIRKIRDLVNTEPELLVPKINNGTLSEVGSFQKAPVRSFGVQRLWRIRLKRGRSKKEVYATAEHRWLLESGMKRNRVHIEEVVTQNLKAGDRLKNLDRCPVGSDRGQALKLPAMQGFVFGDGGKHIGDRPATLDIHEGKDEVFLPMFSACCDFKKTTKANGKSYWRFYGLPQSWKQLPDITESRSFLMGWLSGWFAADGCVDSNGVCVLHAANASHLEFARSVCALLGIQCSPVRTFMRAGFGGETELSEIKFNRHHVTDDFFWLVHHKQNIIAAQYKPQRRAHWVVESVEETDRVEEVYCATVEGVGAFGLSDGLMTGNCFFQRSYEWIWLLETHPDLFWHAAEIEETTGATGYTWQQGRSLRDVAAKANDIKERRAKRIVKKLLPQQQVLDLFDDEQEAPDLLQVASCGLFCGK